MDDKGVKSGTHDYLIVLGILKFFCFLLPYQINHNCFLKKIFWVNTEIRVLIKLLGLCKIDAGSVNPNETAGSSVIWVNPFCLSLFWVNMLN